MEAELIEFVNIDNKPANKCPDFDDECKDVIRPEHCWIGDWGVGMANGYCPMMFKSK